MTAVLIDTNTRQNAFAQLGTNVADLQTGAEVLDAAQLSGWNVRKLPLFTEEDGERIDYTSKVAIVRTHPVSGDPQPLGDVSPKYQEVQNEELVVFLDNLVDESGAYYETAGETRGGRRIFVTMLLPDHMKIGDVDPITTRLVVTSSHDGSGSFQVVPMPERFFCLNQLPVAIRNAGDNIFRARHTKNVLEMIGQAREALDLSFKYLDEFALEANRLINTEMTLAQFEEIVQREFGAPEDAPASTVTRCDNKVQQMTDLFAIGSANENIRGTAWAGFNALTEWYDHYSPVRGDTRRAEKAAFDTTWKQNALELVRA